MADTHVLLQKITVGAAGVASITFSNIPQNNYTDLIIKGSGRTTADTLIGGFSFNGVTTNLSARQVYGTGSAAGSTSSATNTNSYGVIGAVSYTANTFGNFEAYFPNYTSSNYKTFSVDGVTENNATEAYACMVAGLWSDTAAINSITFRPDAGNLIQYSTFSLYGVSKFGTTPTASPYAIGGDIIKNDGTYWYHAFLSSAAFIPTKNLSCDVLAVGGGASSGQSAAGGGGAGAVVYAASTSLITTGYTVIVGAGGPTYTVGGNTAFGSLVTAAGGGLGGGEDTAAPSNTSGGSGGGGGGSASAATKAGSAAGSGSSGGTVYASAGGIGNQNYNGGGGGGAGAVGGSATTSVPGSGGAGINTYSTWLSVTGLGVSGYIAGGGGGCTFNGTPSSGGAGGGGAGGRYTPAQAQTAGTANTGGGGGGGNGVGNGAAGGSGLVIVRYLI